MKYPLSKCWKEIFVVESSTIDPQPGYPCHNPGEIMYDNHMKAVDFVMSKGWEINPNTPLDIHRILTRGIPFYEDQGASGQYRKSDVWIGGDKCPAHYLLEDMINNVWYPTTRRLIDKVYAQQFDPVKAAWISHHIFEVIHPFIDGNGRTGRLLFNKVLHDVGEEPRIVFFESRYRYYNSIQEFKHNYFDNNLKNLEEF